MAQKTICLYPLTWSYLAFYFLSHPARQLLVSRILSLYCPLMKKLSILWTSTFPMLPGRMSFRCGDSSPEKLIYPSINIIPRPNFMELVFTQIYPHNSPVISLDDFMAHRLALLFMVLSLGSIADITRPPCSIEAEEYHTLSRACLCVQPVYQHPSLHAVQTMVRNSGSVVCDQLMYLSDFNGFILFIDWRPSITRIPSGHYGRGN